MALTLIPDVERVASDCLRTHADIVALDVRIVGKSPPQELREKPWVRVTRISGGQVGQPDHLAEAMVQFDCYAGPGSPNPGEGGQAQANTLARTVRAVLGTLPGTGGVTGVEIIGDHRDLDTDLEPARDVVNLTALIWAHA